MSSFNFDIILTVIKLGHDMIIFNCFSVSFKTPFTKSDPLTLKITSDVPNLGTISSISR